MFLILCFIDKKIFVYNEIEIKSKVDKENEKNKTNTVSAHISNLWSKQNWKGRKSLLLKMLYSNILPFIHINNSEKFKKKTKLMDKLIDRWIIFFWKIRSTQNKIIRKFILITEVYEWFIDVKIIDFKANQWSNGYFKKYIYMYKICARVNA